MRTVTSGTAAPVDNHEHASVSFKPPVAVTTGADSWAGVGSLGKRRSSRALGSSNCEDTGASADSQPGTPSTGADDPAERKRQRRLAKNRNTAAVSRERRRAQMEHLASRIEALEESNSHLSYVLEHRNSEVARLQEELASFNRSASGPGIAGGCASESAVGQPPATPGPRIMQPTPSFAQSAAQLVAASLAPPATWSPAALENLWSLQPPLLQVKIEEPPPMSPLASAEWCNTNLGIAHRLRSGPLIDTTQDTNFAANNPLNDILDGEEDFPASFWALPWLDQ